MVVPDSGLCIAIVSLGSRFICISSSTFSTVSKSLELFEVAEVAEAESPFTLAAAAGLVVVVIVRLLGFCWGGACMVNVGGG